MPEHEADEHLGAGAVLAGAEHDDQAGHDDEQGAGQAEADRRAAR